MRSALTAVVLLVPLAAAFGQPAPTPTAPAAPPKQPEWPKELGGKDLKGWLAELKDSPDAAMRETATKVIPQFGPPARKEALLPLIAANAKETDPGVKINLLIVLGNIGAETPDEAQKLIDPLKVILASAPRGSPYKLHAARGLMTYAAHAADAIPALIVSLDDSAWETRRAAAQALGLIGRPNGKRTAPSKLALDAVSKRIATKKEPTVPVRLELVQAMVVMGAPSVADPMEYAAQVEPYFKAINEQLKDEREKAIQVWLRLLLMLYDGSQLTEASIKKIAEYVPADDVGGRVAALRALALLNDRAKPFVPIITDALKSADPTTVYEAISALAALDELARPALPELEKLKATSKDEAVKYFAGQAIDMISGKKPDGPLQPPQPKKP